MYFLNEITSNIRQVLNSSILLQNIRKHEGGPIWDIETYQKSRSVPKKIEMGDPLVSFVSVSYFNN